MKKIISNRVYDTETARDVGTYYSPLSRTDFGYWEETLYRKKTGEYFVYGEGGPMSRYAVVCGQNEWKGGEKILPMSFEDARQWAEEYLSADAYEKEFGIPEEGYDDTVTVSFTLPSSLVDRLRREAAEGATSMSAIVRGRLGAK